MAYAKQIFLTMISIILLASCASTGEHRHARYVRAGELNNGIHQQAFLDVWGPPDRTTVVETPEAVELGWGSGGARFYKGKGSGEIWHYDRFDVKLLFYRQRLFDYKTKKSTLELRALAKPKPPNELNL